MRLIDVEEFASAIIPICERLNDGPTEDGVLWVKVPDEELQKIERVIIEANAWYKEFVQEDLEGEERC